MKKTYVFSQACLFAFALLIATFCSGQTNSPAEGKTDQTSDQTKADKIDELVRTYAEYGKFNGAVLVAERGNILYKKGFGLANMEWDIPNQTDTKFRLASVSKQFTAMLILQLVAENKLALDVPITTYLPSYPAEKGDKIHLHHLLTHSSGIPNYTSFPGYRELMRNPIRPAEIVKLFADSALQFSPGERFNYSNSGYALLGVIIEEITEKPYEQVLQEKILNPLNMKNTGYDSHRNILKNRATGYDKNGNTIVNTSYIDMSVAYTAGGMYSTVEDLYLWDQALYTTTLLPQKYMDMLFDKHIPAWRQHYGYGWIIGEMPIGNSQDKVQTIEHDGVVNGFSSLILRMPSDHSSILFLNNTGGAPFYEMSKAICGILYDKAYDFPKKSIAHVLLEKIKTEGITAGLSFYNDVKDQSNYTLDENEMNLAGYDLLQAGHAEEAAAVFLLNIEAYPQSSNAYDSYGEALMVLGKKTEAIKNYRKSIKLNPKNENGIQMLHQLGVEIDKADLYMLKTERSWAKEIFTFPLNFAPELSYEGIEEAHFPKGWRKTESPEFWSYAFVWNINQSKGLTAATLENDLQLYFDGLTNVVNKEKDRVLPKTVARFQQKGKGNDIPTFTGTIRIFDTFVTQKSMTLTVLVEKHYCEQKKESFLLCKFSPQEFGGEIWLELDKIKLRDNMCEE